VLLLGSELGERWKKKRKENWIKQEKADGTQEKSKPFGHKQQWGEGPAAARPEDHHERIVR
jgi:hypothetical protein